MYLRPNFKLDQDDIDAIQKLYGPPKVNFLCPQQIFPRPIIRSPSLRMPMSTRGRLAVVTLAMFIRLGATRCITLASLCIRQPVLVLWAELLCMREVASLSIWQQRASDLLARAGKC